MPSFVERVRNRDRLTGGLLRMPNEQLAELSGLVGFDFVVIDCEHGGADQLPLQNHVIAAAYGGAAPIVRVGSDVEILRALDLGAEGILVPHVSSVERAAEVVSLVKYPPEGERGFAPYTRAARYGLLSGDEHFARTRDNVALFLMIEDDRGLENVEAIAAVAGVDGLMLGPADFAVQSPGGRSGPSDVVDAARRRVREVSERHGRGCLEIVGSAASARDFRAAGAHMVLYNIQQSVTNLFKELVDAAASEKG